MSLIDKIFIENKLENIEKYYSVIKKTLSFSSEAILKDIYKISTIERQFQLIIDAMLDINIHIIRKNNLRPSDDFQSTFNTLAKDDVFGKKFADRIGQVVGLRNRLVHGYEKIDKKLFLRNLKKHHMDFIRYIKYIRQYIKKSGDGL